MAEHKVELRPYQAKTYGKRGFLVDVRDKRQILVDGVFVGYCPTNRQPIPIVGRVPAEVREVVQRAAEAFWNDGEGPGTAVEAPVIGEENNDE